MDFTLLNKIKSNKKEAKKEQDTEFDVKKFMKKASSLDDYSNTYLGDTNPIPVLDVIQSLDDLLEITSLENNMSLSTMVKEF